MGEGVGIGVGIGVGDGVTGAGVGMGVGIGVGVTGAGIGSVSTIGVGVIGAGTGEDMSTTRRLRSRLRSSAASSTRDLTSEPDFCFVYIPEAEGGWGVG